MARESEWSSQTWHVSLLTNEPQINSFSAVACAADWNQGTPEKICFCSSTNAGTQQIQLNLAPDGSTNGEWIVLNEWDAQLQLRQ